MKRILFISAMMTAAVFTSCTQSDDLFIDNESVPVTRAGETGDVIKIVNTEGAFLNALNTANGNTTILLGADITLTKEAVATKPVTITTSSNKKIISTSPLICKANVTFKDLEIDATTPKGKGAIQLSAEGIDVVLDHVTLTQHTAGSADGRVSSGIGIMYEAYNNSLTLCNNTTLTLPNNYVRGICMLPAGQTTIALSITDSKITCGTDWSYPSTYARGISFTHVKNPAETPIVIKNSTIEGAFYALNVNGESELEFDIDNSTIDGRAAFNVASPNLKAVIDNSRLVGHNNYDGPSESFANIVMNPGSAGGELYLTNVIFELDRKPLNTNTQYAFSLRDSNQSVYLDGIIKIIDKGMSMMSFIAVVSSATNINFYATEDYSVDLSECAPGAQF